MQKHTFKLFFRYASRYPKRLIGAVISSVLTAIAGSFLGPLVIASVLSQLQAGTVSLDSSWPLLLAYLGTQLYGEVIGWRLTLLMTWTFETAAQRDLFRDVFRTLSNQSMSFHADRMSGSLISQATKINGAFERFWDTVIFQLTPTITSIVTAVVILSFVFWQYALFLFIVSMIFAGVVIVGSRFMLKRNTLEAQASTAMNGRLADVVGNVLTVKSYAAESNELAEADALSTEWRNKSLHSMKGFLGVSTIYSSLIVVINMGALVSAIIASEQQLISIAAVYLAVTYTFTVARQLWEINHIMRNYNRIMGDSHDMTEILLLPSSVNDCSDKKLQVQNGDVNIQQMNFSHNDTEGEDTGVLFQDFSLTIPSSQKVGLVGHSGSGKTTLAKLILRFADVQHGVIKIDGQNISEVSQQSLRSAIAYVPQEPLLFHRSLRENVAYGKTDVTDTSVITALKRANAWEFVEKLPHQLDTVVGERGVKLSGGQRQRIAIARAILKDAPILVLDEATSALDSESEKLIQASLTDLMKDRTSIVIAHRLSTIAKLDRIIVLEGGKIVEDGTHAELIKKKGTYASLWSHQSGGFIEE